ncbi:divalent-cation tolerance protein CutA [Streptomyces sp. NPDC004787]|uniref:divalent-cation tolerance protein CutA n=1 Tax=Streptomyces sp. NPDC004787 TaxID=3154291 RepID=UPI0033BEE0AB
MYVQVVTSIDDENAAEGIAQILVEERLAACVQISSAVLSVYRWEGEVKKAFEFVVCAKTRADLASAVQDRIIALHEYRTPEVLILPVQGGCDSYLDWITAQTVLEKL